MNFKLVTIILLTCSDLTEIRESHFTAQSLRELFQDISRETIFNFMKEINIFEKTTTMEITFGYVRVLLTFLVWFLVVSLCEG